MVWKLFPSHDMLCTNYFLQGLWVETSNKNNIEWHSTLKTLFPPFRKKWLKHMMTIQNWIRISVVPEISLCKKFYIVLYFYQTYRDTKSCFRANFKIFNLSIYLSEFTHGLNTITFTFLTTYGYWHLRSICYINSLETGV